MLPLRVMVVLSLVFTLVACSEDAGETAASPPAAAPAPAVVPPSSNPFAPPPEVAPTIETLLRPDDTLAGAQARLGAGNVVARELAGAEGETLPGWVLYPDDPKRTIEVFLDDANAHPAAMRVGSPETVWRRADGIRIGLTSVELQAMNGRPFEFSGFDWDYGGMISDWRGGTLAAEGRLQGGLTLCPPENVPEDYPSGDVGFGSDDPRMIEHPAIVCEFMVGIGE